MNQQTLIMSFDSLTYSEKSKFFHWLDLFLGENSCPISLEKINEPVLLHGHLFEKTCIDLWLSVNKTHPLTRSVCTKQDLHTNNLITKIFQGVNRNKSDVSLLMPQEINSWLKFHGIKERIKSSEDDEEISYDVILFNLLAEKEHLNKKIILEVLDHYDGFTHDEHHQLLFLKRIRFLPFDMIGRKLFASLKVDESFELFLKLFICSYKKDIKRFFKYHPNLLKPSNVLHDSFLKCLTLNDLRLLIKFNTSVLEFKNIYGETLVMRLICLLNNMKTKWSNPMTMILIHIFSIKSTAHDYSSARNLNFLYLISLCEKKTHGKKI